MPQDTPHTRHFPSHPACEAWNALKCLTLHGIPPCVLRRPQPRDTRDLEMYLVPTRFLHVLPRRRREGPRRLPTSVASLPIMAQRHGRSRDVSCERGISSRPVGETRGLGTCLTSFSRPSQTCLVTYVTACVCAKTSLDPETYHNRQKTWTCYLSNHFLAGVHRPSLLFFAYALRTQGHRKYGSRFLEMDQRRPLSQV